MKLKAKNTIYGLKVDPKDPTLPGETFECDEETRDSLLESNSAEDADGEDETTKEDIPLSPEEIAAASKAALLTTISTAETIEALNTIVHPEEKDAEILAAYDARANALEALGQK